jgi:hypothetical protein
MGPFYHLVPKNLRANLAFRKKVLEAGYADEKVADELWIACSRDLLFWINTFVFTYDPRKALDGQFAKMPFITYEFQDPAFLEMQHAIGTGYDLLVEKSRDMGLTWMCVLTMEWFWQFREFTSFTFSSRNEDLVIDHRNPDSLFWKFDFACSHQPAWLFGDPNSSRMNRTNTNTGSTIDGCSRTVDLGRGGRRTAMLLDEFASYLPKDSYDANKASQHNTNCRLINSTPKGPGRCYDDLSKKPEIKKLRIHWSEHPEKRRGLYTTRDGVLKVLDNWYRFPLGYPYVLDGKVRSPWYDAQCKRAAYPQEIAQELDIDSTASDFQFFSDKLFMELRGERMIHAPWKTGHLNFDDLKCEPGDFIEGPENESSMFLWFKLDERGKPPRAVRYVIGLDVSEGTGASNSVASVFDQDMGCQVAEYACPTIPPHQFGRFAVALARWFNDAFLIWECQGPGRDLEREVIESGYRKFYYRRIREAMQVKYTNKPGWMPTKDSKRELLGNFQKGLSDRTCTVRSGLVLKDASGYVFKSDGKIEHVEAGNRMDPTGARDSHGDRALAAALAWSVCKVGRRAQVATEETKVLQGSFAFRQDQRRQAQVASAVDW